MVNPNPENIKNKILTLIQSINSKGNALLGNSILVIPISSLETYNLVPPELGFNRSIAWIYSIYFESGKVNIKYLSQKFSAYQIELEPEIETHRFSVNNLRTLLQHDTAEETPHNQNIQSSCRVWFNDHCGRDYPFNENDWQKCLISILLEAEHFFKALDLCMCKILEDKDFINVIVLEWKQRIVRYHPPNEFDQIIETVVLDLDIEKIDIVKFREKHHSSWTKKIQLLKDYDFNSEVRKMVEQDLLVDIRITPPFDGKDIMSYFEIQPGRKVRELLNIGHSLIKTKKYSTKEEILIAIREEANEKGLL